MSWIKLDDQFAINDKVTSAGPLGLALHIAALCHCGRNLTDGFVRGAAVRGIAAMVGIYQPEPVVAALVAAELWHEVAGGYAIHDYLDYNPSREQVEAKRKAAADRQRAWREQHRNADGTFGGDEDDDHDDGHDDCHDDDHDEEETGAVDDSVTYSVTAAARHGAHNAVCHAVTEALVTSASPSRSPSPIPDPVPDPAPVVVPERARAPGTATTTTADPLVAQFFSGLRRLGVMVGSQMQAEAYQDVVARIRGHPQAAAFMAQLFDEAAKSTSGRITPRWFEVVTERCLREGRLPGARAADHRPRDDVTARNAPVVDWDAVQREAEEREARRRQAEARDG